MSTSGVWRPPRHCTYYFVLAGPAGDLCAAGDTKRLIYLSCNWKLQQHLLYTPSCPLLWDLRRRVCAGLQASHCLQALCLHLPTFPPVPLYSLAVVFHRSAWMSRRRSGKPRARNTIHHSSLSAARTKPRSAGKPSCRILAKTCCLLLQTSHSGSPLRSHL